MVKLTRINGAEIVINAEWIEFVESLPDTIVTLTNNQKILVKESVDEVIDRVISYRQKIYTRPLTER